MTKVDRVAEYVKGEPYDERLPKLVLGVKQRITEKDNDFLALIIGSTGTGKSNLGLHIVNILSDGEPLIDHVALTQADFTQAVKKASVSEEHKYVFYDEANITGRNAMTRWNKQLIDLYFSIRGLNLFHIWCNPSLKVMDKVFLEERVNVVFLVEGNHQKYRKYTVFRQRELLMILKKYGSIDLDMLNKIKGEYGWYRGVFLPFKSDVLSSYLDKKKSRMLEKVDSLAEEFGNLDVDWLNGQKVRKALLIGINTLTRNRDSLIESGDFIDGEHYRMSTTGFYYYSKSGIDLLRDRLAENRKRSKYGKKEESE